METIADLNLLEVDYIACGVGAKEGFLIKTRKSSRLCLNFVLLNVYLNHPQTHTHVRESKVHVATFSPYHGHARVLGK